MHVTIVTIMVNMELMMTVVSYRTSDGGSYHPLGKTKMMVRKKIKKKLILIYVTYTMLHNESTM